jgi:hypothetical protein
VPGVTTAPRSGIRLGLKEVSLAKTSSATKNGAILGSEGLNTISIASNEHGDFGRQDPRDPGTRGRVRRTYIY